MENVMDKFLGLISTSSEWGQSSNRTFMEYLIGENKQLQKKLEDYKHQADVRQRDIMNELTSVRERNMVLERHISTLERKSTNLPHVSVEQNFERYVPTPKSSYLPQVPAEQKVETERYVPTPRKSTNSLQASPVQKFEESIPAAIINTTSDITFTYTTTDVTSSLQQNGNTYDIPFESNFMDTTCTSMKCVPTHVPTPITTNAAMESVPISQIPCVDNILNTPTTAQYTATKLIIPPKVSRVNPLRKRKRPVTTTFKAPSFYEPLVIPISDDEGKK